MLAKFRISNKHTMYMKSWIFTFFLFVTTLASGQSTVADIAQKLGVTYTQSGSDNTMVVVNDETIGMSGSLDAYGYMTCYTAMAKVDKQANILYGPHTALKTEVNAPSYIDSYSDFNKMETAISVGSAWVSIIWKWDVNKTQDLYLSLDCHKGSYSFLVVLQNKPEADTLNITDVANVMGIKYLVSDSIPANTLRASEDDIAMHGTIDSLGFASVHQAFLSCYKAAEVVYGKVDIIKNEVNLPSCKISEYREVSRILEKKKGNVYVIWKYATGKSKNLYLVLKCEKEMYTFLMMLR